MRVLDRTLELDIKVLVSEYLGLRGVDNARQFADRGGGQREVVELEFLNGLNSVLVVLFARLYMYFSPLGANSDGLGYRGGWCSSYRGQRLRVGGADDVDHFGGSDWGLHAG